MEIVRDSNIARLFIRRLIPLNCRFRGGLLISSDFSPMANFLSVGTVFRIVLFQPSLHALLFSKLAFAFLEIAMARLAKTPGGHTPP